ncbi:hypothetical protein CDV36_002316 [Fusarium kuroshium]|uniref:Peptidase S8/S53 domain-containing protein n=1 Tax=Fusarium kuroshium TaxID=2010991 RepID=A0A3M2SKA1_9HYPO|nr:hypothetical protein CDV36_002316 [Fusarium kuroshium]
MPAGDKDVPKKVLPRVASFRVTVPHEVSPRKGYADQPKQFLPKDLRAVGNKHGDIADDLFKDDNKDDDKDDDDKCRHGRSIFQGYNDDPSGNILTSRDMSGGSVFHAILKHMQALVKRGGRLDMMHAVPPVAREFLEWLFIKHPDLLNAPDDDDNRPLDIAALKVKPVVFLAADLVLSDEKLRELSAKPCTAKLNAQQTDVCHLKLPDSLRLAFEKKSTAGACLHDTLKVEDLKKWSNHLKEIVVSALLPRKTASRQAAGGTILHSLLDESLFARKGSRIKAESFRRLIELCNKETLEFIDAYGQSPLHKAILLYQKDGIDFEHLHGVIHSLVKQCPSSIYLKKRGTNPNDTQTTYSLLQSVEPQNKTGSDNQQLESWRKTVKLLKHTCIGDERDRDEKLVYLYGGLKNAREIHFDIASPDTIDGDFVTNTADAVMFRLETALEYVSLRRDILDTCHLSPPVRDTAATEERNPYQGVFNWLQDVHHVEKIFKVIVEDLVSYPHTDEAIRTALKPFKVEQWDWRKLDICSRTILDAAPLTRELHLQCSGNEAVLQSWACESGLAQLEHVSICLFSLWRNISGVGLTCGKLKSLTVTMHPDLRETKEDCVKYFDRFMKEFCRRRPSMENSIYLKWIGEPASRTSANTQSLPGSSRQSDQVAWVQTMKPFIEFMDRTIKNQVEDKKMADVAYVRIALIDNGVYSRAQGIPFPENGKSWHGQRDKDMPFRDYYTGPSRHGTQMAQCIYQVCPMTRLYVARMDDSSPHVEKFTVDSAIKAIIWATEMDVDVISMSWTFEEKMVPVEQRTNFKNAIQKASNKGIILLSSLNDKEMTSIKNWLPVNLNQVIKVGSATKWGDKAEFSKRKSANYLFPGQDIPLPSTIGSAGGNEKEVASGSSLATAFAAGLAGLIIYTGRALSCLHSGLSTNEKEHLNTIATHPSIERVFRSLAGKPNTVSAVDIFVELGSHFPKDPDREADEGGKAQVLWSFFTKVLF